MTPGQTCANCRAFAPLESQCRRHAPAAAPVMQENQMRAFGIYPFTERNSWCEEWVPEYTPTEPRLSS